MVDGDELQTDNKHLKGTLQGTQSRERWGYANIAVAGVYTIREGSASGRELNTNCSRLPNDLCSQAWQGVKGYKIAAPWLRPGGDTLAGQMLGEYLLGQVKFGFDDVPVFNHVCRDVL